MILLQLINKKREITNSIANHILYYPMPISINYFWSFGSLVGLFFSLQVVTGIFFAMHYTVNIGVADSISQFLSFNYKWHNLEICHSELWITILAPYKLGRNHHAGWRYITFSLFFCILLEEKTFVRTKFNYYFPELSLVINWETAYLFILQLAILFGIRGVFSCWAGRTPNNVLTLFQLSFLIFCMCTCEKYDPGSWAGIIFLLFLLSLILLIRRLVIFEDPSISDSQLEKLTDETDRILLKVRPWDWHTSYLIINERRRFYILLRFFSCQFRERLIRLIKYLMSLFK